MSDTFATEEDLENAVNALQNWFASQELSNGQALTMIGYYLYRTTQELPLAARKRLLIPWTKLLLKTAL
jgi:hypothetical protein